MMHLHQRAALLFGPDNCLNKMQEEVLELALAITHCPQGKVSPQELAEEMAGAIITINKYALSGGMVSLEMLQQALLDQNEKLLLAVLEAEHGKAR